MSAPAMRSCAAALAMLLALVASNAEAAFWITPDPVVAGQPSRAVFSTVAHGGVPQVEVQVDGDRIRLLQSNLCLEQLCFSTWVPAFAEARLPPLESGSYTVELLWEGDQRPPVEAATIEVQQAGAVAVLPAEGFWAPVDQPGSGLFLERRGGLLAVSAYEYFGDGTPLWLLGAGEYGGATAPIQMRGYGNGDCLDCRDYRPALLMGASALQLRFESARRAWLDTMSVAGVGSVPVVSTPFGATYIPHVLADTVDEVFGPLPLPDLRGRWIFGIEGADAPIDALGATLEDWTLEEGVVRFVGDLTVECSSATEIRRAGCHFRADVAPAPPPPEPLGSFYGEGWFVPLGDLEEDRMRGSFEADGQTWRVQGFRTAAPPSDQPGREVPKAD